MSDERFDRLELRIAELGGQVKQDFLELSGRTEQQFGAMDKRFAGMGQRFEAIDRRFEKIDQRFGKVDEKLDHLANRMLVLHEEVIHRIAAIGGPPVVSPSAAWMADVDRKIASHDGLLPMVREHEVTLRRHDEEIEKLKGR